MLGPIKGKLLTAGNAGLLILAAMALAASLGLTACGGGTDEAGSSSATTTEAPPHDRHQGSKPSQGKASGGQEDAAHGKEEDKGGQDDSTSRGQETRQIPVAGLKVTGGGSAQFHVKGGDNSVQEYGDEAGEAELRQAAEATHSLFVASVREEWARACSLLASSEQMSLERLSTQSPQPRDRGCQVGLAALARPLSGSTGAEMTRIDAASLRHEGEVAFLIYVGAPEATVYAMPLRLESGVWKPAAITGTALPGVPTS